MHVDPPPGLDVAPVRGRERHNPHGGAPEVGPALRRPTVGAIEGSRYRNMRELRPRRGRSVSIRLLFVFDPARRAIFLVAGDKAERRQWEAWYSKAIKEADARYESYLEALQKEERNR